MKFDDLIRQGGIDMLKFPDAAALFFLFNVPHGIQIPKACINIFLGYIDQICPFYKQISHFERCFLDPTCSNIPVYILR